MLKWQLLAKQKRKQQKQEWQPHLLLVWTDLSPVPSFSPGPHGNADARLPSSTREFSGLRRKFGKGFVYSGSQTDRQIDGRTHTHEMGREGGFSLPPSRFNAHWLWQLSCSKEQDKKTPNLGTQALISSGFYCGLKIVWGLQSSRVLGSVFGEALQRGGGNPECGSFTWAFWENAFVVACESRVSSALWSLTCEVCVLFCVTPPVTYCCHQRPKSMWSLRLYWNFQNGDLKPTFPS